MRANARRRWSTGRFLLAFIVYVAASPASADFTPPINLSAPSVDAGGALVGVDSAGNALVIWSVRLGGTWGIQARAVSATGVLGPIKTVTSANAGALCLGMQPDGTALIVWQNVINETGRILHRRISPAGVLQPIQILAVDATYPGMAVAGTGYAVAVWYKSGVGIQVRARPPTGNFGAVQNLGLGSNPFDVAVDADGDALIVWQRFVGPFDEWVIEGRRRSRTGTLGPVINFSGRGRIVGQAEVAMDRNGNALVIWETETGHIHARAISAANVLGPIQNLTAGHPYFSASEAEIAFNRLGMAYIVWHIARLTAPHLNYIQGRVRTASGALGPIQNISSSHATSPQLAFAPNGDIVFVWSQSVAPGQPKVRARVRLAEGVFGAVQTLSAESAVSPQVAVDRYGDAIAVWSRFNWVQAARGP